MKSFFKMLLASTFGVIIGSAILGVIGILILVTIMSMSSSTTYDLKNNTVFELKLKGSLSDRTEDSPFGSLFGESSLSLEDILTSIEKAKNNDEVKGIYLKSEDFYSAFASLEPIRNALLDFKKTGKFIVAYGDTYSQNGYYLASVADKIILNPEGAVDFHGLSATLQFAKNFYDKIGISYQVIKVGTFKSAVEPYVQEKMSEPNRLQMTSYINDVWGHMIAGISESRNISVEQLNKYADQFLAFEKADSLVNYKMVDTVMYEIAVDDYLAHMVGVEKSKDVTFASVKNMVSVVSNEKKDKDNRVAVLYAEGPIMDEASKGLFGAGGGSVITPEVYVKELKKLAEDDKVKAVVFRVNSPGGSAYASEQIWNAVSQLKAKKPVVVSMGDYAASGGYYISCAADVIVAEPTTLTGSIGIFGLIPNGTELAKKLGYTFDEVKTNENAGFGGKVFGIPFLVAAYSRGLTDKETDMLQKYVEKGYDLFVTRCADGRSKTKSEIDSIGQGRVWTGNQALANGLVDKLGGLDLAIKIAAEKAKLEKYSTDSYPAKKDFLTQLMEDSMDNSKIKALQFFMGNEKYEQQKLQQQLKGTDIRMATMPDVVSF